MAAMATVHPEEKKPNPKLEASQTHEKQDGDLFKGKKINIHAHYNFS
jgi:hypothetical protein